MSLIIENWSLIETLVTLALGAVGENFRQRKKSKKA